MNTPMKMLMTLQHIAPKDLNMFGVIGWAYTEGKIDSSQARMLEFSWRIACGHTGRMTLRGYGVKVPAGHCYNAQDTRNYKRVVIEPDKNRK